MPWTTLACSRTPASAIAQTAPALPRAIPATAVAWASSVHLPGPALRRRPAATAVPLLAKSGCHFRAMPDAARRPRRNACLSVAACPSVVGAGTTSPAAPGRLWASAVVASARHSVRMTPIARAVASGVEPARFARVALVDHHRDAAPLKTARPATFATAEWAHAVTGFAQTRAPSAGRFQVVPQPRKEPLARSATAAMASVAVPAARI
jgi:hypothetical protein